METKGPRTIADQTSRRRANVVSTFAIVIIGLHIYEVYPFEGWEVGIVLFVGLTAYGGMEARIMRRWRDQVLDADFRICLNCGYDLRGSSETGNCPECGQRYTYRHLERLWSDWMVRQFPKWRSRLGRAADR